jgi:hypothetical protein
MLPERVLWGILIISIALAGAFFLTHASWYDHLHAEQRTQFWNEFFVAYGTLALALVTWASVYETQQVLAGDDLRFRQDHMPVLWILEASPQLHLGYRVKIYNEGAGDARDAKLTFRARIGIVWKRPGEIVNSHSHKIITCEKQVAASYIAGRTGWVALYLDLDVSDFALADSGSPLVFDSNVIEICEIEYSDMFGTAGYKTVYPSPVGANDWEHTFEWTTPTGLLEKVAALP